MYREKRGRDLLPKDMMRFRHAERIFREEAIRWGYQEVRTPTIEPISLFTAAGTLDPRMLDNLYSFLDWDGWSGERVVLRPDGTIPTSRLFIERFKDAADPVRLCYIANIFSYDEEGTSEHWQCGVELIEAYDGSPAASDAEVVALSLSVLGKMGFPSPLLKIGYPPLIREFLEVSGLTPEQKEEVLGLIREKDREELTRIATHRGIEKLTGLLDLTSGSVDFLKNVRAFLPKSAGIERALADFSASISAISDTGFPFEITFALPLNFEYYTGLVMEVYPGPGRTTREEILMSGGRYDNLAAILSGTAKSARAVGCALRIEHIIKSAEFLSTLAATAVLVVPGRDIVFARHAVSVLRDRGLIAEISGVGQDPKNFRWVMTTEGKAAIVTDSFTGKVMRISQEKIGDVPDLIRS